MKKPTLKNQLAFNKAAVSELNQDSMKKVIGGTGIGIENGVAPIYDEDTKIIGGCTPIFNPFQPTPSPKPKGIL